jgi:hypothetical protein
MVRIINMKINPQAGKSQVFEQLLFEYQPTYDLSPGRHIFNAVLGNDQNGGGVVRFSIPFTVKRGERDCDDDRDEEDWNEDD